MNTDLRDEQLKQIRERHQYSKLWSKQNHIRTPGYSDDIDFLLSLLDSQAASDDYEQSAHEILSEYNSADNPGLLRTKVAEGFASAASNAATRMRDACVEVVEEFRQRIQYGDDEAIREAYFGDMVIKLESLTLDQVNQKE